MLIKKYLLLILITAFTLIACSNESDPASSAKPSDQVPKQATAQPKCNITMGWDPWEPYMYMEPNGSVNGLDIELIKAISSAANCHVTFIQDDWMSLLKKIQAGEIDMVAGASITEKRKLYSMFSAPYRQESFSLYIRAGESAEFKPTLQGILDEGKKLGITTDYIYGDTVSQLQDNPKYIDSFVNAPIGEVNYSNLLENNIDAFIEDPFVGAYKLKIKGIKDKIEQLPLVIHSGEVHLMFSIKSVEHTTVEKLNDGLEKIKQNGLYDKILRKYLL